MKPSLRKSSTLVTAAELAEIIGADIETINNWTQRGIISRAAIGGRQLRARLFSTNEVYKAAITNELVRLGIQPSPASEAANQVWNEWEKKGTPEGQKIYAIVVPSKDGWTVELCLRKASGGPLYRWARTGSKSVDVELPRQAFAVLPISDVFDRISHKLFEILGGLKDHGAKGKP
jgi:hypothetical protein